MTTRAKAISVLAANTGAFTVCFAVWMLYGVLITYLMDHRLYQFSKVEMGWLLGIPVLSGSIFRLPVGMLTDRYGGRPVYAVVMLVAAVSVYFVSFADTFREFLLGGLGFGFAGTAFAVGIAYTSVWFPPNRQGTALRSVPPAVPGRSPTRSSAPPAAIGFPPG